jgi:Dockerin type I domain
LWKELGFGPLPGTRAGAPGDAFELTRDSDNKSVTMTATVDTSSGASVFTLNNFKGPATDFGSLADGRFTLRILASQISNFNGQLDGDVDGNGGDDYVLASAAAPNPPTNIFRLYGDANGDGTVNAADFLAFRLAFLSNSATFDFDGDGQVNAGDFLQFRLKFLQSI